MTSTRSDVFLDQRLEAPAPEFSIEQVSEIASQLYGLTGKPSPLGSERDQNFLLKTEDGAPFVLRIANQAEEPGVLEMQIEALDHIARVDPGLPVPRLLRSLNQQAIEIIPAEDGTEHLVRVVSYLPGNHPERYPTGDALLRPAGKTLARLTQALGGFFHPAANHELQWDLKHAPKLRGYLGHTTEANHLEWIHFFLNRFDQNVQPVIPTLRAQIVHNDLAPHNLLVDVSDPARIQGVIDFSDLVHTPRVNDLAIMIASMIYERDKPAEAAAEIAAAYLEIIPLEPDEIRLLYDLIGTRLAIWVLIANWRVSIHPDNREYIIGEIDPVLSALKVWREQDPEVVTKRLLRAGGLWELETLTPALVVSEGTDRSLLSHRSRVLSPTYKLFYKQPLHIVRGEGVWLYDDDNHRYLDAYNNVPHVGHSHPHVVNAIAHQARLLNTNTRYLHGLILELAERITSKLPEPLSVCIFVCTGSEANELAWRMAKLATGNTGALVTQHAYHGNGDATIGFSTEAVAVEKLPPHVKTLFAPSSNISFRDPDSGLNSAIEALDKHGHEPAMLLLDTAFTSEGIFTSPRGYLMELFARTRATGGLCVADEVQAGFGRLGGKFWGFEFDDVVPDIVTMGKPMGNGHPIGAVVTRPEIAQTLADETGYFNTFGGNPVSCAAGLAVLDVIETEGLQRNARDVGRYLHERLAELGAEVPFVGEPHGSGLLQGIDIIQIDGSPNPELAGHVLNHMRMNGVLVGLTGPNENVLKVRPPLVFLKEHVDILIAAMKRAFNGM